MIQTRCREPSVFDAPAHLPLSQFFEQKTESICSKLGSVKGGWRERAQSFGNGFGSNRARGGESAARKALRQERRAGDGCCTAAAQETRFGDAAIFDAQRELQDVAANWICRLHLRTGVRQLADIARISEVIQDQFAEHRTIVAQLATHLSTAAETWTLDCKIRQLPPHFRCTSQQTG